MRLLVAFALTALAAFGCSAGSPSADAPQSFFWDGSEDIRGSESLSQVLLTDTTEIMLAADTVAVVEVTEVDAVQVAGPLENEVEVLDPRDQAEWERFAEAATQAPTATVYAVKVAESVRGDAEAAVRVEAPGGLWPDGQPSFVDGRFLLEPGRTYLLTLTAKDDGTYTFSSARASFDLTEGVKVLNHPDTRDLEHFENMTVEEFVNYVRASLSDAE